MKRGHKIFLIVAATLVITVSIVVLTNQMAITGFVIHSEGCGSSIVTAGEWELEANLDCTSTNGITISTSGIDLNCQDHIIQGSQNPNFTGIIVSPNLTDVLIENCDLQNFTNPISIGVNSNLQIQNSYVEQITNCVSGSWTDVEGNTGCLDTTGPVVSLTNQSLTENQSLNYQVIATDPSGIANYSIENSENSSGFSTTVLPFFSISQTGLLTSSALPVGVYTISISVKDTIDHSTTKILGVLVTQAQQQNTNQNSQADSSSGGSSSSSDNNDDKKENTKKKLQICGVEKAWSCIEWGECTNGFERRTCTKNDEKCNDPLPQTKRPCTLEPEEIPEETPEEIIESNIVEEEKNVAITGKSVNPLEKLKGRNAIFSVAALALIAAGFVLTLVLNRRRKIKQVTQQASIQKPSRHYTKKDDSKKLWDWEEHN
jgi:hypothetical protein